MTTESKRAETDSSTRKAVEAFIKIGCILLLLNWCFNIIQPFINPLAWGLIIAIAIYPFYLRLAKTLADKNKLAAIIITMLLLVIILGPCAFFASILIENVQQLIPKLVDGTFSIPSPTEKVADWPLIGKPLYNFWQLAANNLSEALLMFKPQVKAVISALMTYSGHAVMTILQMIISVIICSLFLINSHACHNLAISIGQRIAGEKGEALTQLSTATIRSVARGVLGVALIQSLLAGAGFLLADVPGAGILTVLCLFIAVIQLPTFILLLPVIIYVFSVQAPLFAIVFSAWMIVVGLLDNVLKPILMGRGTDLPMAVIFMGAIGGMIYSGIIGLFVGAVVLALSYRIFFSWLNEQD